MSGTPHLARRRREIALPLALVLSIVLAIAVSATQAQGDAGGCELLGFPSENGAPPAPAPACQAGANTLYAGNELPAPVAPPPSAPHPVRQLRMGIAPVPPTPVSGEGSRGRRPARTDTTIVVRPGMKFTLSNHGGSITIHTWPRNAVRVMADHGRRDWVEFHEAEGALRVSSETSRGPSGAVAYDLTVPAWLPVALSGIYNDVSVDGLQGGIDVETVRGDIVVRRAAGVIGLRSVEGVVDVEGARGSIAASSVNEAIRIAQAVGSVTVEAVNGDIQLVDVDSRDVEATTVNGGVVYDGRILDGGAYRFTTHSGDIALGLAESANATVSVSTFSGDFESAFAIQPRRATRGQRFRFVLGNGKARVDLESFQGSIELLRPGGRELRARVAEAWRDREREFGKAFGQKWKWKLTGNAPAPDAPADEAGNEGP